MKTVSELKVAIVHDWLIGGGAERVVLELHRMFPEAPIYTSYATAEWREKLDHKVVVGYLQRWPFSRLRKFIPFLRAWWFSHLNFAGYDLVISSSGAEAKGIRVPKGTLHINYCHAPTHYYWSRYEQYLAHPGFNVFDPLARRGLRLFAAPMRRWDLRAAQRPDVMVANSTHTQSEIKKYYGRSSVVIHPPVDVDRFQISDFKFQIERKGFVIAGRQTPYKRIDLAVAACTRAQLPLTVIGDGPDHQQLQRQAGATIRFIAKASADELVHHFQSAEAFIFPGLDDFGITPVEALAAGTPVIAFNGGGALDYVIPGKTGLLFNEPTSESLAQVLSQFNPAEFQIETLEKIAAQFAPEVFQKKISGLIENNIIK